MMTLLLMAACVAVGYGMGSGHLSAWVHDVRDWLTAKL